ncbi:MAG: GNAT family N-acetyltransferase [Candidatus Brocadiaceae bacterium]
MNEVAIREAEAADLERVVEIALAAWEPYFAWRHSVMGDEMFACFHPDWQAEKARQIRTAWAAETPGRALVAELKGRVVGFVVYYSDAEARFGVISNNAVHPDCQGRGIGPRMYEEVLGRLRADGCRFVKVETGGDPFHARARRAYEKVGFNLSITGMECYRAL